MAGASLVQCCKFRASSAHENALPFQSLAQGQNDVGDHPLMSGLYADEHAGEKPKSLDEEGAAADEQGSGNSGMTQKVCAPSC